MRSATAAALALLWLEEEVLQEPQQLLLPLHCTGVPVRRRTDQAWADDLEDAPGVTVEDAEQLSGVPDRIASSIEQGELNGRRLTCWLGSSLHLSSRNRVALEHCLIALRGQMACLELNNSKSERPTAAAAARCCNCIALIIDRMTTLLDQKSQLCAACRSVKTQLVQQQQTGRTLLHLNSGTHTDMSLDSRTQDVTVRKCNNAAGSSDSKPPMLTTWCVRKAHHLLFTRVRLYPYTVDKELEGHSVRGNMQTDACMP